MATKKLVKKFLILIVNVKLVMLGEELSQAKVTQAIE
jgi:hypothetical protein